VVTRNGWTGGRVSGAAVTVAAAAADTSRARLLSSGGRRATPTWSVARRPPASPGGVRPVAGRL